MDIIVTETGPGRFAAWLNGELLCHSRTPLLSAARELQRRGVRDEAGLSMRHEGTAVVAMTTTVGAAARLTVSERDRDVPRFAPYHAPPAFHGSPNSAAPEFQGA